MSDNTEIVKAIASLEAKIDNIDKRFDSVDKLQNTVYGNGKVGLVAEVDRINQQLARSQWLLRACIVICLGLFLAEVFDHWKTFQDWKAQQTSQQAPPQAP